MDENADAPTGRSQRSVLFTIGGAVIVIIATILYVWAVSYKPAYSADRSANSAVTISTQANGQKVYNLELNIQQSVGAGPHSDWLGYQTNTNTPHPGTMIDLPKNALVSVTIHNFDSQTVLRNTFFTLVQGTVGNVESVDGKRLQVMDPTVTSHTFTIPDFGVSVPMEGISSSTKPGSAVTMKFSFRTPNRSGVFRWQCIVPCGSGLYGNGGPMSEMGYMQGLITLS